jgi:hypothetical protein
MNKLYYNPHLITMRDSNPQISDREHVYTSMYGDLAC